MVKALVKLLADHFGMGDKKDQILKHIMMRKTKCISPSVHSVKAALLSGITAIVGKVMSEMDEGKEYEDGTVHALIREVVKDVREKFDNYDDDAVAHEVIAELLKIFGAGVSIAYSNLLLHIDCFVSLVQSVGDESILNITVNFPYLDADVAKVSLSAMSSKDQLPAFEFLAKFAEKVADCRVYLTNGVFEEYLPNEPNLINIRSLVLTMAKSIITIDAMKEKLGSILERKFGKETEVDIEEFMRVAAAEVDTAINYLKSEYGVEAQKVVSSGVLESVQYDFWCNDQGRWMDEYEEMYGIEKGDYDVDS